jgi:5'-methylthioadenosine phosphorylase
MALVTDYDCWHDSHESVTVDMVIGNLIQNSRNAQVLIVQTIEDLADRRACVCSEALKSALITDRTAIPPGTVARLQHIVGKYLSHPQA